MDGFNKKALDGVRNSGWGIWAICARSSRAGSFGGGLAVLLCVSLLSAPAYAERYALLIGISDYQYLRDMDGPVNDVGALRKLLTGHWGFANKNVSILTNQRATKERIKSELALLMSRSQPGDHVFIYYSGHGTSRLDARSDWPLPYTSGALIPVDFQPDGDIGHRIDQLLVGRWELRPLLEALDRGKRSAFVVIDACFSGNTVRSQVHTARLPHRYVDLASDMDDDAHRVRGGTVDQMMGTFRTGARNRAPYPYRNVFFLSASGEHEFASEIATAMLAEFPTLDGKPHGAFTDALLRALSGELHADSNHDGRLSYSELHRAVRRFMDTRGYAQTPRALPVLDSATKGLSNRPVFGLDARPIVLRTEWLEDDLRVKVQVGLTSVRDELSGITGVKLVDGQADLFVIKAQDDLVLLSLDGKPIVRLPPENHEELLQLVKYQKLVKVLTGRPSLKQRFNINLDLTGSRQAGMMVEGEHISFSVSSERDAYLLLLAIDPIGTINVLYPPMESKIKSIKAGEVVRIPDEGALNSAQIRPPFGRERIVAIAFEHSPDALAHIVGAKIDALSPKLHWLESMVKQDVTHQAHAVLQLETIGYTKKH